MAINETQSNFLAAVRSGRLTGTSICATLARAPTTSYRADGYLEMLFAIDATHRVNTLAWYTQFIEGIKKFSYLFDNKAVCAAGLVKIEGWQDNYGVGEWGVELLMEMMFEDERRPPTMEAMIRNSIRGLYNGIYPVTEHGLFVLQRWLDQVDKARGGRVRSDDAKLLGHINRHTKGLKNAEGFARIYSELLAHYALDGDRGEWRILPEAEEWLEEEFLLCDEMDEAEERLVKTLTECSGEMPESIGRFFIQDTEALFVSG